MNQEQESKIKIHISENENNRYDDSDNSDDYIRYTNSPEQRINSITKNTEKRVTYNEEEDWFFFFVNRIVADQFYGITYATTYFSCMYSLEPDSQSKIIMCQILPM